MISYNSNNIEHYNIQKLNVYRQTINAIVKKKKNPQITKYKSLIPLCFNLKPNCA